MSNMYDYVIIKSLPTKKIPELGGFTAEFHTFLFQFLSNYSKNIEEERILPSSFFKVSITLIPKSDKDTIKRENSTSLPR